MNYVLRDAPVQNNNLLNERISIIIPAYNEEKRIKPILNEVCSFINERKLPWNVILSIDGTDGTETIANEFSYQFGFIRILKSDSRSGYGGAIKRAVKEVTGNFVIILEADGALDFSVVVDNLYWLNNYDIVNFNRHANKENKIPLTRRLLSKGYNLFIEQLFDLDVTDVQGGYKMLRTEAAKALFKKITITGGFFQAALFFYSKRLKFTVKEVRVPYRHIGGSKFDIGRMIMGGLVSGLALRIRNSRFYRYVPKEFVNLYYKKFRWI